jgi:hypothetical protein
LFITTIVVLAESAYPDIDSIPVSAQVDEVHPLAVVVAVEVLDMVAEAVAAVAAVAVTNITTKQKAVI